MRSIWHTGIFQGGQLVAELPFTGRELIVRAFKTLQILRAGQGTNVDIVSDAFDTLNEMVDGWNAQRLMMNAVGRDVYDLTSGQMVYVMGDAVGIRPLKLEAAGILTSGSDYEDPISVLSADPRHTSRPGVYFDGSYPAGELVVSPVPSDGQQIVLYTWRALEVFGSLDTPYSFAPGYGLALRLSLAVELWQTNQYAIRHGAVDIADLRHRAAAARRVIASANRRTPQMSADGTGAAGAGYRVFP